MKMTGYHTAFHNPAQCSNMHPELAKLTAEHGKEYLAVITGREQKIYAVTPL